jgi:hypothetical protein
MMSWAAEPSPARANSSSIYGIDGIGQHLALVGVELKVGISHAVVEAGELRAVGAGAGKVLVEFTQPGEHDVDQVTWVGLLLPDVAPFTCFISEVNGGKAALLALEIDVFQALEEEQIGDLLDSHQGVGEAGGPEAVPEFVDFFLDVRGKHSVVSLMDQAASFNS